MLNSFQHLKVKTLKQVQGDGNVKKLRGFDLGNP